MPSRTAKSGLMSTSVGTAASHSSGVVSACHPWRGRHRCSGENRQKAGAWYRSGSRPGMFVYTWWPIVCWCAQMSGEENQGAM